MRVHLCPQNVLTCEAIAGGWSSLGQLFQCLEIESLGSSLQDRLEETWKTGPRHVREGHERQSPKPRGCPEGSWTHRDGGSWR